MHISYKFIFNIYWLIVVYIHKNIIYSLMLENYITMIRFDIYVPIIEKYVEQIFSHIHSLLYDRHWNTYYGISMVSVIKESTCKRFQMWKVSITVSICARHIPVYDIFELELFSCTYSCIYEGYTYFMNYWVFKILKNFIIVGETLHNFFLWFRW